MSAPVYSDLSGREPWADRPWVSVNMVTTLDGKILSGERDENVMDLGSATDHATMRAIEAAHDAVMIGAGSLRATVGLWYPSTLKRFVVSGSGKLDFESRFFTDAPESAWVVTGSDTHLEDEVQTLRSGPPIVWQEVLREMAGLGIRTLLVEGGSELNASLFHADLIDEVFWTIAPKVKLGRDVPTFADGEPLPREKLLTFELVSHIPVGDELFLRYLRRR